MIPFTLQDHPIHQAIYDLCQQIERCGCSTELTEASVMASNLQQQVAQLRAERRMFIPAIGDTYVLDKDWTFKLYQEDRNYNFTAKLEDLGLIKIPPTKPGDPWSVLSCRLIGNFTLPKGTELKVSRIYIRQGQQDYNSVSFNVSTVFTQKKMDGEAHVKVKGRFWAKLDDVNQMYATLLVK